MQQESGEPNKDHCTSGVEPGFTRVLIKPATRKCPHRKSREAHRGKTETAPPNRTHRGRRETGRLRAISGFRRVRRGIHDDLEYSVRNKAGNLLNGERPPTSGALPVCVRWV